MGSNIATVSITPILEELVQQQRKDKETLAEPPAAGTGTVMRPDVLRRYAADAGFRSVDVLPIDHFFFQFYRLNA